MTISPKPGVFDIAPYVGGNMPGAPGRIDLSSNESALGPSPMALRALKEAAEFSSLYPEGSARALRQMLGAMHGLDPTRIVCGNGSNELLSLLAKAYVRPGDEVLFGQYAFLVYRLTALSNSAVPVAAPERELTIDVDALLARVTPKTRLLFLANPNNPTGTYLPGEELRRLHAGLPEEVLLVIDSAYAEYVQRDDYEDGHVLVADAPNVVMTRTFSKVYGLAGLRVGWAYCPAAVADILNRVRDPFNVSVTSQSTAVAAVADVEHVRRSVAHNGRWRAWLTSELREAGLSVGESVGNFALLRFADEEIAAGAYRYLAQREIILRPVGNYGLPDCLRLTVGTETANRKVVAALKAYLAGV